MSPETTRTALMLSPFLIVLLALSYVSLRAQHVKPTPAASRGSKSLATTKQVGPSVRSDAPGIQIVSDVPDDPNGEHSGYVYLGGPGARVMTLRNISHKKIALIYIQRADNTTTAMNMMLTNEDGALDPLEEVRVSRAGDFVVAGVGFVDGTTEGDREFARRSGEFVKNWQLGIAGYRALISSKRAELRNDVLAARAVKKVLDEDAAQFAKIHVPGAYEVNRYIRDVFVDDTKALEWADQKLSRTERGMRKND